MENIIHYEHCTYTRTIGIFITIIATASLLIPANIASAVTPPDSCFVFDSATGAINDYGNDTSQGWLLRGTCSADVECIKAPTAIANAPALALEYSSASSSVIGLNNKTVIVVVNGNDFDNNVKATIDGVEFPIQSQTSASFTMIIDIAKLNIDSANGASTSTQTATTVDQRRSVDLVIANSNGESVTATGAFVLSLNTPVQRQVLALLVQGRGRQRIHQPIIQ